MKLKIIYLIPLILLLLTGCKISLTGGGGTDGGVFKSEDRGESWTQKVFAGQKGKKIYTIRGTSIQTMIFNPQDSKGIYITTTQNGIYKTADGAENWQATAAASGSFPNLAIDSKSPEIIYASSGGIVFKSPDGGGNWQQIYSESKSEIAVSALAVDWFNANKIYVGNSEGSLLKSNDYGNQWSVIMRFSQKINRILIDPKDSRTIYLVTNSAFYKSTKEGEEWVEITNNLSQFPGANTINDLIIGGSSGTLYLTSNYGLLKSADAGTTWQAINTLVNFGSLALKELAVNPQNENEIFFSVSNFIHKSTDGGLSWKVIKTIPTSREISNLLIDPSSPNQLYVGVIGKK